MGLVAILPRGLPGGLNEFAGLSTCDRRGENSMYPAAGETLVAGLGGTGGGEVVLGEISVKKATVP